PDGGRRASGRRASDRYGDATSPVPRVGASRPRPAVALEKVVDPGAGALERPIRGRDVLRERLDAAGRLRALVHAHPDAGPIHHFAAAEPGAAARTVAHLLGAGLW